MDAGIKWTLRTAGISILSGVIILKNPDYTALIVVVSVVLIAIPTYYDLQVRFPKLIIPPMESLKIVWFKTLLAINHPKTPYTAFHYFIEVRISEGKRMCKKRNVDIKQAIRWYDHTMKGLNLCLGKGWDGDLKSQLSANLLFTTMSTPKSRRDAVQKVLNELYYIKKDIDPNTIQNFNPEDLMHILYHG